MSNFETIDIMYYDFKEFMQLEKGDKVLCTDIWLHARGNLTEGKEYEVLYITKRSEERVSTWRFCIKDDNGKKRTYKLSNTMFKKVESPLIGLEKLNPSDLWVMREAAIKMQNSPILTDCYLPTNEGYKKVEHHELEHFVGTISAILTRKVYKFIK